MTSYERVMKTIRHEEPDRVPTGEFGLDHDHVSKIIGRHTYWRNRKDTTLALWDNRRDEVVESMKEDYAEVVEKLDYDIVAVQLVPSKRHFVCNAPKQIDAGIWEDTFGNIYKYCAANDSIMCMTKNEGVYELTDEQIEECIESADCEIDDSCFELVDYLRARFPDRVIICRDVGIWRDMFGPFGGNYYCNKNQIKLECF